jgi:hypothetical protein
MDGSSNEMRWRETASGDEHARSTRQQYEQKKVRDIARSNELVAVKGDNKHKVLGMQFASPLKRPSW